MISNIKLPLSSDILSTMLGSIKKKYPFVNVTSIGKSVMGKDLWCVRLGYGVASKVFICGAHHALEWITSAMLMRFIEDYCIAKSRSKRLVGYNINYLFENSSVYIVPMVNPDGVDIVVNGISDDNPYRDSILNSLDGRELSSTWQANIRGVDLNHNYDAGFDTGKSLEPQYGILGPGPTRFGGEHPESEPETRAICEFVRNNGFSMALSYHSQGEVIYWDQGELTPGESETIVKTFSSVSGYLPDYTEGIASHRGFKDWFITEFGAPAFTIEVGRGKNPLPLSQLDGIYLRNIEIIILSAVL